MNPFISQPEFISEDPRSHCPGGVGLGHQLTPELAFKQHRALLPPDLLQGKTVLDLGSCLAASGAWSLANGAKHYTGVEIQKEFADKSAEILGKYYPADSWRILNTSVDGFLNENPGKYDIVLAAGVLHGVDKVLETLEIIAGIADLIVIESMHKSIFHSPLVSHQVKQLLSQEKGIANYLENESYISVGDTGMLVPGMKSVLYNGLIPSMGAIKRIMRSLGFLCDESGNHELKAQLPASYSPLGRFCLHFQRAAAVKTKGFGFEKTVDNPENVLQEYDWRAIGNKS